MTIEPDVWQRVGYSSMEGQASKQKLRVGDVPAPGLGPTSLLFSLSLSYCSLKASSPTEAIPERSSLIRSLTN